jgi:hypothetical protein
VKITSKLVNEWLDNCTFTDPTMSVTAWPVNDGPPWAIGDTWTIQVNMIVPSSREAAKGRDQSRIPIQITATFMDYGTSYNVEDMFYKCIARMINNMYRHEAREAFHVKGELYDDPHKADTLTIPPVPTVLFTDDSSPICRSCKHSKAMHFHYRRGTDCGFCGCTKFVKP